MKIRKAILTGGGRATRLYPITTTINKHLLPLANKPMIFHAIEKVVAAGIEEIFINTNPGETELQKHIGDGGHWGVKIKFFEQTGGPLGIAHAVNEAKHFIGDEPFMFYLSDNIVLGGVKEIVAEFEKGEHDCMLTLSAVPDPERFGVPVFDAQGKLTDVIEKPQTPQSNFAVTGIYLYGPKIFFDTFQKIEKSARGEYEISSIHSHFVKNNFRVGHKEITGWWKDTGKPEDLLHANELLLDHAPAKDFVREADTGNADIFGKVRIGAGTMVGQNVKIIGPVMIGANCTLEHCSVGPHVSIGSGSEVSGASIRRSIILDHSTIKGDMRIAESIIGKHTTVVKRNGPALDGELRMIIGDKTVLEW